MALETECPGIVSCADILALAARDLIIMLGGPYFNVQLGRKDSLSSHASDVVGKIPMPTMSIEELITLFKNKGFTAQEMVALTGAHTVGFSHCKEFADRFVGSDIEISQTRADLVFVLFEGCFPTRVIPV